MSIVSITIEGTTPLIQNKEIIHPDTKNLTDWKQFLYLDESELLYQPAIDLSGCFAKVLDTDGLSIVEQHILFEGLVIESIDDDPLKPIYLRGHLPLINTGWRLSFTIKTDNYTKALWVKGIITDAGRRFGIGHLAPKYGRFKVVELEIED